MSPFWISFFEDVKDCGRNATLFVVTLGAILLGLLVVWRFAGASCPNTLSQHCRSRAGWPCSGLSWPFGAPGRVAASD